MADQPACEECERLKKYSQSAYRDVSGYRPMHTDRRSKSRWFKGDKAALTELERAYNLANANYQLHLATHSDSADARDVVRNLNILAREGRLKP
jgi:phosphoglycolate phosphatase-like HAD superfamily hydrolase